MDQAHAEFASAQSDLSSPLFAPITVVPVLGRQFSAVRDLSSAAGHRLPGGIVIHLPGARPARSAPQRRARAGGLAPPARGPVAVRRTSTGRIDTGPSQALVSSLASKHNEFVTQLYDARVRLTKAAAVSAAVASILQGPQTYLVLAANNAEMRAGSGAFLDVGVADTSDGSVNFRRSGHRATHAARRRGESHR